MRAASVLIIAVLLLPSAWLLSQTSDIPQFGVIHDDALYYVSAESLADGGGYRIMSLPGEPAQTKYPPLYPLLLSFAWRINPSFPENMPIAAWLSWLAMPLLLLLLAPTWRRMGFSGWRVWVLLGLFATNAYVLMFSTQLLTELWFLVLSLASMLLIERGLDARTHARETGASIDGAVRWILLAGAVAGLAYLTRSAALALLAAGGLYLWIRGERKLAGIFSASMLPFLVGWTIWTRVHQTPTGDPALFYYLDYLRYHFYSFPLGSVHLILWKNVDGLLSSLGSLILPNIFPSPLIKMLTVAIAVGMILGTVRLVRQQRGLLFALFALLNALMLIAWSFPPNERLVMPLFPVALSGLLTEIEHLSGLLAAARRHPDRGQRIVAMGFGGVVAMAGIVILGVHAYMAAIYIPQDADRQRARLEDRRAAYAWIRDHIPAEAAVFSKDDPLLYLYTGRHAMRRPIPPPFWYTEDHESTIDWLGNLTPYAEQYDLSYLEFSGVGADQGLNQDEQQAIAKAIESNPDLIQKFAHGKTAVYAVEPDQPRMATR